MFFNDKNMYKIKLHSFKNVMLMILFGLKPKITNDTKKMKGIQWKKITIKY